MSFQIYMTFVRKGEGLKNVHAALFPKMEVNGNWAFQATKKDNKCIIK